MSVKESKRRDFLKGALAAGAAAGTTLVAPKPVRAQTGGPQPASAATPSAPTVAAETMGSNDQPMPEPGKHVANPGSDFMIDVFKNANLEYVAMVTSSAMRGLQESIVNYGGNRAPQLVVCCHEEVATGMAHGYAKMAGKPMGAMMHSVVGLQHASMAIYNAWCDRVPVMVVSGNTADANKRLPGVEWFHTAVDPGAMVRDMVKWDDAPASLQNFGESFMRARMLATTPPMAPVLVLADSELQEEPIGDRSALSIPPLREVIPPEADAKTIAAVAKAIANAAHPVIVVDRTARSQEGVELLVKLAESLNAPVIDLYGRMNFPTNHFLHQTGRRGHLLREADVILALVVNDVWGLVNHMSDTPGRPWKRVIKPDAQVISISSSYLYSRSAFGDVQRYLAADMMIGADAQTTLPDLIEAVTHASRDHASTIAARKKPMVDAYLAMRNGARRRAAAGWDASPISTARLCQEIWAQIKHEKWSLVSQAQFESFWPQQLWDFTDHKHFMGNSGGYGIGYGLPAAAGAALACKAEGRIAVDIQPDGDLMFVPSVLWTLAHHKIPLLIVMHNNRAWHQETMHVQRIAVQRDRDPHSWRVGTLIEAPYVDFAGMAKSMGVWAEGPISDPAQLGPALQRALAVVKSGQPALLDVVTQPR